MSYIFKRIVLMLPTLLMILLVNFLLAQTAPGGPIEQQIAKMQAWQQALTQQGFHAGQPIQNAHNLSPEMLLELQTRFGFDLPLWERFWVMLKQYATLDFGHSFFQGRAVIELIAEKLPVTMLFGALSLLVMYGFGIFLGAYKAAIHRRGFDYILMLLLSVLHALPVFMIAVFLLLLFAGSDFWQIFPIQGVTSENFVQLSLWEKALDLIWHLSLPVLASSIGSIAGIAYLTKFSLLNESRAPYVRAMMIKGFSRRQILYQQMLKNALLPIAANLPLAVVGVLFSGNFLIEVIFGIDGIGRLAYDAVQQRDYPLMFGILFIFTVVGMVVQLFCDILYQKLDPRIDYEANDG